ncbi:hypothetical protein IX332_001276 [Porphyromonas levii]|nr:hypothetical protein [Porphyromonas levii]MBR8712941.1 hypothetical protein [Porphyromonas levii]MBR8714989.1 hypothetical protein [Porphyromonas levii]MBR8727472.1 hypothetical protein [Porphyromonas levii]MBR8729948.1 hypothetical protein [Porphyromonas levii]
MHKGTLFIGICNHHSPEISYRERCFEEIIFKLPQFENKENKNNKREDY